MQKIWKIAAWIGGGYAVIVLAITVYLGYTRPVMIVGASSHPEMELAEKGQKKEPAVEHSDSVNQTEMLLQYDQTEKRSIYIPVEASILPEQIQVQDFYADKCLMISLQHENQGYYKDKAISGKTDIIENAFWVSQEGKTEIVIQLCSVYTYDSYLENGILKIDLFETKEKHDRTVILDVIVPENKQVEEALLYQMEQKLEAALEKNGIKAYHTYGKEGRIPEKQIGEMVSLTGADFYVGLSFARDEQHADSFGSYVAYKGDYYIPQLTNSMFADCIEKQMVTSIQGKANGLEKSEEKVLEEIFVPAVIVYPGYATNETELSMMKQDSYQNRIAEGITAGIMDAYQKAEERKGNIE